MRKKELALPATPVLLGDGWWGVVSDSYLRLNNEAGKSGEITATLRRGDLVRIMEVSSYYDSTRRFWLDYYRVVDAGNLNNIGWASSEAVERYETRPMAVDAQMRLKP